VGAAAIAHGHPSDNAITATNREEPRLFAAMVFEILRFVRRRTAANVVAVTV